MVISSRDLSLIGTAAVAGASFASLLTCLYFFNQQQRQSYLSESEERAIEKFTQSDENENVLLQEQLSRTIAFFGKENFPRLQEAFVVVVGLGGVGSHAAHFLARSGVKRIRLVDFDNVTLSSLNRHAVAGRADVGKPKVIAMKEHLRRIIPTCEIEAMPMMFSEETAEEVLSGSPTFVLDCIDDVLTKICLIETASKKNLRLITSMGSGGKADPTRVHISTLTDAIRDPLATKIRYYLRKKNVDPNTILCVYSSEKAVCGLLPLDEQQQKGPQEYGAMPEFRIRVLPVLGTMPAIFGETMTAYVLTEIGGRHLTPESVPRLSREHRNKLYQKLQQREYEVYGESKNIDIDKAEVDFIVREVWQSRSSVSETRIGGIQRMILSRWHRDEPLTPYNTVVLTMKEVQLLDRDGKEGFEAETIEKVNARLLEYKKHFN